MYVNEESKYQSKQIMNSVWRNPDNGNFKIKNPILVACSNNLQIKQYFFNSCSSFFDNYIYIPLVKTIPKSNYCS